MTKTTNTFDWALAAKRWKMPSVCPVCRGNLELNEKHTELFCDNIACKTKLVSRVHTWTRLLKAKQWAPVTIEKLIDNGLVGSIAQLYMFDYNRIANIDGFGQKTADTLERNLKKTKEIPLATFIAGFNINDIGEKTVTKALKGLKKQSVTLDDLFNCRVDAFVTDGISWATATKLYEGIRILKDDMRETAKYVKVLPYEEEKKVEGGKFAGLSFCFTGASTDGTKRSVLEKFVTDQGGTISAVNKKLSYLVSSEWDTGKAKKARELGTKVVTYDEFFEMLRG